MLGGQKVSVVRGDSTCIDAAAATAAADPPDEPPGTYFRFHGFFVGPYALNSVVSATTKTQKNCKTKSASKNMVFPDNFYSTTNNHTAPGLTVIMHSAFMY